MSHDLKLSMLTVSSLLIMATVGLCQPSNDMQNFPSTRAGYGLTGHDVTGDGKIDLVTSHVENGGELWRNDYANNAFDATAIEDLVSGRECKFGGMVPGNPWYLAMTSSENTYALTTYEVDRVNHDLDIKDEFSGSMDYVSWGRVNPYDNYQDLVATDYNLSQYVQIYTGNADGTLDYSGQFNCGDNTDPDQIALAPMGFYYQDLLYELIIQDARYGNNYIRVYTNNNGSFNSEPAQNLNVGGSIEDFCIGDINRDGYFDLVVCAGSYVKTYLNNHNGQFQTSPNNSYNFGASITQVALGELNYDGYKDILLYYDAYQARIYQNAGVSNPGHFNFSSYDWMGEVNVEFSEFFPVEELMFVDLKGAGAYSVAMTGNNNAYPNSTYYLCVFFDNRNVHPEPVSYQSVDGEPGGNPTIHWEANDELDMDKYIIYRALMEDESKPEHEDFDSLAVVSHPTTEYTDTTVIAHAEYNNYKIWYAVTAFDNASNESDLLEMVSFWGYYEEEGQGFRFTESARYQQPGEFAFSAAPNPFNPITTLSYDLPEAAFVTLKVYDASGRCAATLIDNQREAGQYQLSWDAGSLPSGVYFAQMQAGGHQSVQKLLLTK